MVSPDHCASRVPRSPSIRHLALLMRAILDMVTSACTFSLTADVEVGTLVVGETFTYSIADATAFDLETLGETIRNKVRAKSGIELKWEIRRMGHFLPDREVREFLDGDVFVGAV